MLSFEDIEKYLPRYLSESSTKILFSELKEFPKNIDRIYTRALRDKILIFQGDGLTNMLVVNLPDTTVYKMPAMVLSNTCDLNPENKRYLSPNIIYAPIVSLKKYERILQDNKVESNKIEEHLRTIRGQFITQIFYLPNTEALEEESIVLLDKIMSCASNVISPEEIRTARLFTLSDYGFYVFLFKLSMHFTRIQEKIDRQEGTILKD